MITKQGLINLMFVQLAVPLLFFQQQLQWICRESDPIVLTAFNITLYSLTALFLLYNRGSKIVCLLSLFGFMMGFFIQRDVDGSTLLILVPLFLVYGYCVIVKSEESFNRVLKALFFVNAVVMLCQLLGVSPIFYRFQFYSPNVTDFVSILDNQAVVDVQPHQARMSGIFPSTIYLSLFQFLIFGQMVASKIYGNRTVNFFTGFMFSLAGSTVSLMLFLISVIFLLKKKQLIYFQAGFLIGMLFLFIFVPDIFNINYLFETKIQRIDSRFLAEEGHSLLTSNYVNFIIMIIFVLSLTLVQKLFLRNRTGDDIFSSVIFLVISVSPLIVHPIQADIRYWFIVGTAFAQLMISKIASKAPTQTVFLRRQEQESY